MNEKQPCKNCGVPIFQNNHIKVSTIAKVKRCATEKEKIDVICQEEGVSLKKLEIAFTTILVITAEQQKSKRKCIATNKV